MSSPRSISGVTDPATLLEQFEDAWRTDPPPSLEGFLAAVGSEPALLIELIKIDLDHRWRRARSAGLMGPLLEEYVARFPQLGPLAGLPADLIQEEYHVRHCWGDQPGHEEFLRRFGPHADLTQIDAELSREPARCPPPGPSPAPAASVTPIHSVLSFLEVLRALPLHKPAQLNEVIREDLQGRFTEPRDLARFLLERDWLTAYQVNQLLAGNGPDLLLANYLLQERLGEGATGQVFKARHVKMERLAAIKVIRPELLADGDVVQRFYREIESAGRLSHPNIVAAYDAGPAGRTHFFAMEYVEGTDLDRLVKKQGPLAASEAVDYIRQAALGLQHAHEKGLVHRDVKPANLLLSARGVVKVLDLGLARVHQAMTESRFGRGLTAEGTIIGTPDYMAPEQADDAHQVDFRADIYSLGCTLYYLLSGQVCFPNCTLFQKLLKIQQAEPNPIEQLRPDLPPGLGDVLRRMMAKRPEERFQTVAAVLQDLAEGDGGATSVSGGGMPAAILAALPVEISADGRTENLDLPVASEGKGEIAGAKRRRVIWPAMAGAVALAGILGLALIFLEAPRPLPAKVQADSRARGSTEKATKPTGTVLFEDNFEKGTLAGWHQPKNSAWRLIADGQGRALTTGPFQVPRGERNFRFHQALQCGDFGWRNYAVNVSVQFRMPDTNALILGRINPSGDYYWLEYFVATRDGKPDRIELSPWRKDEPVLYVGKVVKGKVSYRWVTAPRPQPDRWHRLRFELQGSSLRGFVDGKLLLERRDEDLRIGRAGLTPDLIPGNQSVGGILWARMRVETLPPLGEPTYLADLQEQEVAVGRGVLGKEGDLGYDNARLAILGSAASESLSMHAVPRGLARVAYRLKRQYHRFEASAAIADAVRDSATPLTFQVKGDGKILWTSLPLQRRGLAQPCVISVAGVDHLELQVHCPGDATGARSVWVDPRLFP